MDYKQKKCYFPEEERINILLDNISEVLETGRLVLAKLGREFEEIFTAYLGLKYTITVIRGWK